MPTRRAKNTMAIVHAGRPSDSKIPEIPPLLADLALLISMVNDDWVTVTCPPSDVEFAKISSWLSPSSADFRGLTVTIISAFSPGLSSSIEEGSNVMTQPSKPP